MTFLIPLHRLTPAVFLAALLLCPWAGGLGAQAAPGAEILAFGTYSAPPFSAQRPEDATVRGYVDILAADDDPNLVDRSPRVRADPDTLFGIEFRLLAGDTPETLPVLIRVRHPPLANPHTGRQATVDQWTLNARPGVPRFVGWHFAEDWERVPGEWSIQVLYNGRVLVEQVFQVQREARP